MDRDYRNFVMPKSEGDADPVVEAIGTSLGRLPVRFHFLVSGLARRESVTRAPLGAQYRALDLLPLGGCSSSIGAGGWCPAAVQRNVAGFQSATTQAKGSLRAITETP